MNIKNTLRTHTVGHQVAWRLECLFPRGWLQFEFWTWQLEDHIRHVHVCAQDPERMEERGLPSCRIISHCPLCPSGKHTCPTAKLKKINLKKKKRYSVVLLPCCMLRCQQFTSLRLYHDWKCQHSERVHNVLSFIMKIILTLGQLVTW